MDDVMAQLREWSEQIAALPEPIGYIVLDHAMPAMGPGLLPGDLYIDDHDERGRRYLQVNPCILDEMRHTKAPAFDGLRLLAHGAVSPLLTGIPVYKREDMPEGWPAVTR